MTFLPSCRDRRPHQHPARPGLDRRRQPGPSRGQQNHHRECAHPAGTAAAPAPRSPGTRPDGLPAGAGRRSPSGRLLRAVHQLLRPQPLVVRRRVACARTTRSRNEYRGVKGRAGRCSPRGAELEPWPGSTLNSRGWLSSQRNYIWRTARHSPTCRRRRRRWGCESLCNGGGSSSGGSGGGR